MYVATNRKTIFNIIDVLYICKLPICYKFINNRYWYAIIINRKEMLNFVNTELYIICLKFSDINIRKTNK